MKKRLAMLLVGGLLAVQLTACSGSESKETSGDAVVTSEVPVEDVNITATPEPTEAVDTTVEAGMMEAVPTEGYSEETVNAIVVDDTVTPTATPAVENTADTESEVQ